MPAGPGLMPAGAGGRGGATTAPMSIAAVTADLAAEMAARVRPTYQYGPPVAVLLDEGQELADHGPQAVARLGALGRTPDRRRRGTTAHAASGASELVGRLPVDGKERVELAAGRKVSDKLAHPPPVAGTGLIGQSLGAPASARTDRGHPRFAHATRCQNHTHSADSPDRRTAREATPLRDSDHATAPTCTSARRR
jgi:hypothetical protein